MILRLRDSSNRLVAEAQLAGTTWLACDGGFYNREPVTLQVRDNHAGPFRFTAHNDLGDRLSGAKAEQLPKRLLPGDSIVMLPGKLHLFFTPERETVSA